jgi:3-oxoacyl-[acyl-carrier-protein] synthase-3
MTNADYERMIDTTDEWIVSRTGIRERRHADPGIDNSDMAVAACRGALEMSGTKPEEVDLVIIGTVTPDYLLPSTACVVQEKMGLVNAAAFDIVAACTGFINGLSIGNAFIKTGQYKKALVVGSERLTSITNFKDRGTCVLFGDGAGAVVLEPTDGESGILSTHLRSDGRLRELLWIPYGGSKNPYTSEYTYDGTNKVTMNGSDVFKVAVREMGKAADIVVKEAGLTYSDISLFVPHQANIRIIEAMAKRMHLSMDKVMLNIDKYGNTSSGSVPLALDEANRSGRIHPGDNIVMVAFGGGLIWGAAAVKW